LDKSSRKNKKNGRKRSGKGYILKNFISSRKLYKFIWSLTKDLPLEGSKKKITKQRKKYHRFIMHLFVSMRLQSMNDDKFEKQKGSVPISSELIENVFGRKFYPRLLKEYEIIEIKPHNTMGRQSREFRIVSKIFDQANSIQQIFTLRRLKALIDGKPLPKTINVRTGRRKKAKVKSKLTSDNAGVRNTNKPKLIRDSIKSLKPCPFNPKYAYYWLEKLNGKYEREKRNYKIAKHKYKPGSLKLKRAEKEYRRAQGRYLNDNRGIETILNQNPKRLNTRSKKGDLLYKYKAAYSVQKSGRVSEINGGFQSSSKYLKHLLFRDMKNMTINYDLKDSQAHILLQELKACNIRCKWLESYLNDSNAKEKYADDIGISVDVWKECFYSLIMGSERKAYGAVHLAIKRFFKDDYRRTSKAYNLFMKKVEKLSEATEKWRDHLFQANNRRYCYMHKGITYWQNACGMRFKEYGISRGKSGKSVLTAELGKRLVTGKREIKKCKRKLAAFMLQGRESRFTHHLTVICTEAEIPVYKNEHDGIITGNQIPERLTRRATEKAGLRGIILNKKPLCKKVQRLEMRRYVTT
jgi:hypothetical protein